MKLMLVEDDDSTIELISTTLIAERYTVDITKDEPTSLNWVTQQAYDMILLSTLIPELDVISFCQHLRSQGYQMPILLLLPNNRTQDIVAGLEAGADDYLTKPVNLAQMLAKIRALFRRTKTTQTNSLLVCGKLTLDRFALKVTYDQQEIELKAREYKLLELLMRNPRRVFSRNTIIDQIWTSNCYPTQGAVTNLVKDLRRQFKRAGIIEEVIETVFGLGYRLKASSDPKVEKSSEKQEQGSAAIAETLKTFLKNPYQEDWLTQDSRSELSTMAALSEQCASCRQTTAQPNAKKNTSATHSFKSSKASWPILPHQAEPKTELLEATAVLVGDSVTSRSLSQFLKPWGIAVIGITNPQALWNTFITLSPHLLVLDLDSDTSDNIKLCREIVTDPDYQELPILVLTNQTDPAYLKQLLATGINDFINKPIVGPEVVSRVVNCLEGFTIRQQWLLQCSNYRKLQQTNIDALTQLPNRYLFECHLQHVWKELSQKQEPIVLILSEIDDFQRYLSCCGYAVGNKCLQKIAQTLQQSIGLSGSVARYGKTEFAILLPSTQLDTALSVTQKIQQRMTELNTQQRLGVSEPLTMSMGIVGIVPPSNQTVKALIKTAAHALATAKTQGRNTYCVYSL